LQYTVRGEVKDEMTRIKLGNHSQQKRKKVNVRITQENG